MFGRRRQIKKLTSIQQNHWSAERSTEDKTGIAISANTNQTDRGWSIRQSCICQQHIAQNIIAELLDSLVTGKEEEAAWIEPMEEGFRYWNGPLCHRVWAEPVENLEVGAIVDWRIKAQSAFLRGFDVTNRPQLALVGSLVKRLSGCAPIWTANSSHKLSLGSSLYIGTGPSFESRLMFAHRVQLQWSLAHQQASQFLELVRKVNFNAADSPNSAQQRLSLDESSHPQNGRRISPARGVHFASAVLQPIADREGLARPSSYRVDAAKQELAAVGLNMKSQGSNLTMEIPLQKQPETTTNSSAKARYDLHETMTPFHGWYHQLTMPCFPADLNSGLSVNLELSNSAQAMGLHATQFQLMQVALHLNRLEWQENWALPLSGSWTVSQQSSSCFQDVSVQGEGVQSAHLQYVAHHECCGFREFELLDYTAREVVGRAALAATLLRFAA